MAPRFGPSLGLEEVQRFRYELFVVLEDPAVSCVGAAERSDERHGIVCQGLDGVRRGAV